MNIKSDTSKQTDQARNSGMDKTDAYHPDSDPYASQGGGKLGSGMVNSGHPANNAINPHSNLGSGDTTPPATEVGASQHAAGANVQSADVIGTKGSGAPLQSAAGQRADDRPGRDDPKTAHASSSLNTHEYNKQEK